MAGREREQPRAREDASRARSRIRHATESVVAYLIDEHRFARDSETERRARLIVVCGATVAFWGPFFAAVYAYSGFPWIAAGVIAASCTIGGAVLGLRYGWPAALVGNILATSIFAIHTLMVVKTGGILSPALPWLCVFTICGFGLASPKSGYVWLGISGAELLLLAVAAAFDLTPSAPPEPELARWLTLAAVAGLCGTIFTFARAFETQKDRSLEAYRRATVREREANATKSRFLANVSHEVRTPMKRRPRHDGTRAPSGSPRGRTPPTRSDQTVGLVVAQRPERHPRSPRNSRLDTSRSTSRMSRSAKSPRRSWTY